MDLAFQYTRGELLESEANYPYKGKKLFSQCEYNSLKGEVTVTSF